MRGPGSGRVSDPSAGPMSGVDGTVPSDRERWRRVGLLLWLGLPILLSHAFIPIEEFIHRGDDAFYYFKLAVNFPKVGFWTFDGIHPTNGVQPLWAILLTAVAQLCHWVGVADADVLARLFVGLAGLFHFASTLLLYRLLSRQVSVGTGIAVAGAFLLPLGIVWSRVWGIENALYAFLLVATVYYFHTVHRERATARTAAVVGGLLGLTALARLNAGLLVPCLLAFSMLDGKGGPLATRFRRAVVIGAAATLLLLPYFLWNQATTGHLLPVSGAVKTVRMEQFLEGRGLESVWSLEFLRALFWFARRAVLWFFASRILDGTWLAGGRGLLEGWMAPDLPGSGQLLALCLLVPAAFLAAPLAVGRPGRWFRFLGSRLKRLAPFWYVLAFGAVDAVVSVLLYPYELRYAMVRWWFVQNEIVVVTLTGTLVAAALGFVARHWIPRRLHLSVATAWLALLFLLHGQRSIRFYFDGEVQYPDWHLSWNDESYRAAQWINRNLPEGAVVGSWNAGVVGYYARRPVVNLDGLINGFDYLPYLREGRIAEYIENEGISHLSDIQFEFTRGPGKRVIEELPVVAVYRNHSEFIVLDYVIYQVERGGGEAPGGAPRDASAGTPPDAAGGASVAR